ncbi:major facilitator superfamily domain-containing protein [Xylogone sp. PMI_703]|nr:major facilitator superfamily domain-containing protein [Xylogone sp. PMI_703]
MASPKQEEPIEAEKKLAAGQTEHIEGTVRLFDADGGIRKIPIPSQDPTDPLNWSLFKRCVVLTSLCMFGTAGFGVIQSTPLFFGEIIAEYERETRGAFAVSKIGQLASYPSLCMGLGNFLFVPLSMMLGRRAVFLFNNALMLAAIVWAGKSSGFNSHLAARCIQGLSCGLSDCLLPIMILDMTFLHRRALWMSFYWASTAAGSTALLVAVPFVVQGTGADWRTNYWFWSGFSAFSLLLAIIYLPETLFPRAPALVDGRLVITDQYGNVTFVSTEDVSAIQYEQHSPADRAGLEKGGSYWHDLKLVHYQENGIQKFLKTYVEMFLSFLNPSVFFVLVLNSLLFGGLVCQSLTYTTQLQLPPWNFSPAAVGTAQAGSFVGALVALGLSGATADRLSGYLTKRNGGIREPEHVLPNFILPTCFAFGGMVLYGVVGGHPERYAGAGWISIHIGFGMYYCGFIAISAISGMWIGEVTPHYSGAALVLVCGGRNAVSFAISNNFTAWIASQGFQDAYIQLGAALLGVAIVGGVPLYLWNKHLRRLWSHTPLAKAM